AKGQAILELENEKAVAAIPSTAAGTVAAIYVKGGDRVGIGQRLISVTESGAAAATPKAPEKKAAAKAQPEPEVEPEAPDDEEVQTAEPVASPSVRKMARELGIDLRKVHGSQAGGRIIVSDLRNYIQRLIALAAKAKSASGSVAMRPTIADQVDFSQWGPVTKKTMTPLRHVIARRMTESWSSVARVTQFDEVDFTTLNELRKKFGSAYEEKGVKLTLTPLILKAVVETLKKHPIFNSSLDEVANEIVIKEYFHLGIAVDTEQGLMVPVIRDVDKKSVLELAKELEQLAQKTRDRKISGDDMKGGSFTISNQGAIGGGHFTPIVNKPEVAILGLGRGAMKPVVRDGKVEARMMTPLALSYDHRVLDGANAARFMVDLVKTMENFSEEAAKI
ncbi:MAG TPA: 2-oxo acid dehydrogenase subunit E2, partial [Verrucomicrobiae bacterium]|nr:2-oxo acid dehydrogenase subunit E2 [Verrucomicrobiae bacterium]